MKQVLKYSLFSLIMGLLLSVTSCSDKDWSENYDINWPVPQITSLSKSGAVAIGSQLVIKGANFADATVSINGAECTVVSVSADESELTVTLPRIFEEGPVEVFNVYKRGNASIEILSPVYPEVTVRKVNDIPVGLSFAIEGENVDVLSNVFINNENVPIITRTPTKILVNAADVKLHVGQLVTVSFKSLSPNVVPAVPNVNVIYPFIEYQEVIIWDFEDGMHLYAGEGTATVESGASNVPGNTDKYFKLRAPGYGWDKETGKMDGIVIPDITTMVNPYITFAVRTPVGSAGYFQLADQQGNWRHFDYGFKTEGEWMIISQPLNAKWEGGTFDARKFKPQLSFKAGNAGTSQDIDIAYVKITEGEYDGVLKPGDPIGSSDIPARISLMDFENVLNHPDQVNAGVVIGSVDNQMRPSADPIKAFNGSHFYSFGDNGSLSAWGGYWSNTISIDTKDINLKMFPDPYLSFALNSGIGKGKQYVIVRVFQYDGQLEMIKKFFPDSNGLWSTQQFSLFNEDLENWSKDETDIGKHYKSLKRLNKDVAIDRIEVIVAKHDLNQVVVSMDEFTITNGPRY